MNTSLGSPPGWGWGLSMTPCAGLRLCLGNWPCQVRMLVGRVSAWPSPVGMTLGIDEAVPKVHGYSPGSVSPPSLPSPYTLSRALC